MTEIRAAQRSPDEEPQGPVVGLPAPTEVWKGGPGRARWAAGRTASGEDCTRLRPRGEALQGDPRWAQGCSPALRRDWVRTGAAGRPEVD